MNLQGSVVLVTGGQGFTGSHLVSRLVAEGCKVHVISRNKGATSNTNVKVHKINLNKSTRLKKILSQIRPVKVFHLAGYVNASRSIPDVNSMILSNFKSTVNLLNALNRVNYECFINAGTSEEYGNIQPPFREDQLPRPNSPYSATKLASTMYCQMQHDLNGLPTLTLRSSQVYGPYQRSQYLIPYIITSSLLRKRSIIVTKGEQTKDFTYVSDLVDAYILAATNKKAIGSIINIGSGKEYKIKNLINKILSMLNSDLKVSYSLPYRSAEPKRAFSRILKAKRLLGFNPKVSLDAGLLKTINWHKMRLGKNG